MIKKIGKIELITKGKKSKPEDGERVNDSIYGVKGDSKN